MNLRPLLLALASLPLAPAVFAQPVPLTHADILGRLAKGQSPSFVAHLVKAHGVNFAITDSFLTQVKLAGGNGVLVEHLSSPDSPAFGMAQEQKPSEHLAKCAELVHIGDVESAVAECRASIDENPDSPWPLLLTADLLMRTATLRIPADPSHGEEEAAIQKECNELGKRAGDLDPQHLTSSEMESGIGNPYVFLYKNSAANPPPGPPPAGPIALISPDPELATTHRNLAYLHFVRDDFGGAEQELQEAVRLEPDFPFNHDCLAFLYFSDQKETSAIAELREVTRIAPFDGDPRALLSEKLLELGRTSEAIAELKYLLAISPGDVRTSNGLVELYLKHKDLKAAIAELQRSLEATRLRHNDDAKFIEQRFWDLDRLANLLKQARQLDAAAEQYQFLLRYLPENADLHNNYGNVLLDEHRLDEAIAEYSLALRFNPDMSSAHHNIGLCLAQQKNLDGAMEEFRRALDLNPNEPHTQVFLGMALGQKGDLSSAKDEFQQYLEKYPKDPSVHTDLAYALDQLKDTAAAIQELKRALELEPDSPAAQNNLAWIYATADDQKLRNTKEALILAQKAVKGSATPNPAFLDTLAEALLLNGQPAEALQIERQAAALDPNNPEISARLTRFQVAASNLSPSKQ